MRCLLGGRLMANRPNEQHSGRARRNGWVGSRKWEKSNAPPEGEFWIWFTPEMMESPAWGAMTLAARKVVDRIIIKYLEERTRNGELVVLYDDFEKFGIRRSSILEAIAIASGLGWIDVTIRGTRSYG